MSARLLLGNFRRDFSKTLCSCSGYLRAWGFFFISITTTLCSSKVQSCSGAGSCFHEGTLLLNDLSVASRKLLSVDDPVVSFKWARSKRKLINSGVFFPDRIFSSVISFCGIPDLALSDFSDLRTGMVREQHCPKLPCCCFSVATSSWLAKHKMPVQRAVPGSAEDLDVVAPMCFFTQVVVCSGAETLSQFFYNCFKNASLCTARYVCDFL